LDFSQYIILYREEENEEFLCSIITLSRGMDEGQARQRLKNVPIMKAEFSFNSFTAMKTLLDSTPKLLQRILYEYFS
jgi:hypothetical protein